MMLLTEAFLPQIHTAWSLPYNSRTLFYPASTNYYTTEARLNGNLYMDKIHYSSTETQQLSVFLSHLLAPIPELLSGTRATFAYPLHASYNVASGSLYATPRRNIRTVLACRKLRRAGGPQFGISPVDC